MNDPSELLGYGFLTQARDAAWSTLEAARPVKGPNCPLTLELLDLARGQALEAARADELRAHLKGCSWCSSRFAAQQRAVARAAAPAPEQPSPEGYNGS